MKYKCIIFDCGGVLVDSQVLRCKVLVEMANTVGLKITLDEAIENFLGKSLKGVFEYIENQIGKKLPSDYEPFIGKKRLMPLKMNYNP